MSSKPRPAPTIRKTPNMDFIFGCYSYSRLRIPYFNVCMTFGDAANFLRLVNEMPGAASMNWRIEELFQRDVDWNRVERKILPYLKQQDHPQFFNSLTIALLPIRDREIYSLGGEQVWHAPDLENQHQFEGCVRNFGPITCGYWDDWKEPADDGARLGQISWNTAEVCGVAIDGQHRLAAIKELGEGEYAKSNVPVILLVLDPQLGYRSEGGREDVVTTLRRLFIDLNKHAQTVKRARQILLDDRDPASVCVRALVGDELVAGVGQLTGAPPKFPLTLIDWHSEQAKFDEGPYHATILGLDWAVAKCLNIKPLLDGMDFGPIETAIDRLERGLGVDLGKTRSSLEESRKRERPFFFAGEDLEKIAGGFTQKWAAPLVHLLTGLLPYKELLKLRQSTDTARPEFANWNALRERADNAKGIKRAGKLLEGFQNDLESQNPPILVRELQEALDKCGELKAKRHLAFTVVLQRALVFAFLRMSTVSRGMLESLAGDDDLDLNEIVEEAEGGEVESEVGLELEQAQYLVAGINLLFEKQPEIMAQGFEFHKGGKGNYDRFWLCSFESPEGPIDFTQAASKRASDLLVLAGLFFLYKEKEGLGSRDFERLLERARDANKGIDLKLQQCVRRLADSVGAKIVKSRDGDETDGELCMLEAESRARWMWSVIAD